MSGKRVVVITGASKGIGEACALRLDRQGFWVFAGVRKLADGEALRAKASARLTPLLLDVTDAGSIQMAAELVTTRLANGELTGLVNNAGVAIGGPLEFLPLDDLRKQLEINVVGQIAVTQAFLPLLRQSRGRIVNMSSVSGRNASPFLGPYAASKFALEALSDTLRLELLPWHIQVSVIEPGAVATPIWETALAAADEMSAKLPPRALIFYGWMIKMMRETARQNAKRGMSPDVVAQAVEHALMAPRPKIRYLVGSTAGFVNLLRLLPDRLRDRLIVAYLARMG